MTEVLSFVNEHITFQYELNDVYHSPVETLAFKSGDCDDFTSLTATLLEYFGIETAIGLFSNEEGSAHAMVLVNLEDLGLYEHYSYSDLTSYGLDPGKWIIIEPQTTIDDQKTDWIFQWYIEVAAELDTGDYT